MAACTSSETLLFFHPHAFPKRHATRDFLGGIFGRGVVPGGILVFFAVHAQRVVAGLALPGAGGVGDAVFEKLLFEGIGGEVVVVLDHDRVVALGYDGVVPNGFHGGFAVNDG